MIKINNISFSYNKDQENHLKALNEINLQFREGEFIALMGHNSSGKTTLARCLNGLIQPQTGEVLIDKLSTNNSQDIVPIRRKVGMVFGVLGVFVASLADPPRKTPKNTLT